MLKKYAKADDSAYWLFAVGLFIVISRLIPIFPGGLLFVIELAGLAKSFVGGTAGILAEWGITVFFAAFVLGLSYAIFKKHSLMASTVALILYAADTVFLLTVVVLGIINNPDTGFLISTFLVEILIHGWIFYCLWAGFADLRNNPPESRNQQISDR